MMTPRSAALAAAATLLALAAMVAPAVAQKAGQRCGPTHDGGDAFAWIAVPSSRLAASKGVSAQPGANGCATSDRGDHALVSAQLPDGSFQIHSVAFRSSGGADGGLIILAGDANTTALIKELRSGGDDTPAKVLDHFALCQQRRSLNGSNRRQTLACNPEVSVSGQWVVFLAKALTVCDVMVCASRAQFTPSGIALTRKAALSLQPRGMQGKRSSSPAALPGSCAGYTTGNYGNCGDKTCVRTYQPGGSHCHCWHCSAFTKQSNCESGDETIGYQNCCSTCPDQPICAVCVEPCVPVFDRIEVIPGVLPTTPSDITALVYSYTSTTQAINQGLNAQTVTVTFAIAQQLTATMTYTEAFQYSEKATFQIGIPFLSKGSLEFGSQQTFTTTTTNTDARTTTYTTALQQQIPALTMQDVNASATANTITTKVPVTIKTYYTCNQVETKETFALIKTEGTLSATAAELKITYGPQYPIDQPYVYPQANATCSSNPTCNDLGLRTGNCCPDDSGAFKPCCSFCAAKPACKDYAIDNSTMCCPARTSKMNPCCS